MFSRPFGTRRSGRPDPALKRRAIFRCSSGTSLISICQKLRCALLPAGCRGGHGANLRVALPESGASLAYL
jgi:hypothetical protein